MPVIRDQEVQNLQSQELNGSEALEKILLRERLSRCYNEALRILLAVPGERRWTSDHPKVA